MKKLFFFMSLCGCICCLLVGCNNSSSQPLSALKAEDVSSFTVTLRPPGKEIIITDEQTISELVDILNDVTIFEKDNSYKDYAGQWVEFELTMAESGSKTIVAYNPFIIIDGVGYKTEYEPCEKLNAFGNGLSDINP